MPNNFTVTGQAQYNDTLCRVLPSLCGGSNQTTVSTFPSSGSTPIRVNTNPNTGQIQISQNAGSGAIQQWIDAALSGLAIWRGAAYVPTTTQPQQQPIIYANPQGQVPIGGNTGATLGGSIQDFVTNNTGVILIGVAAYILLMSGRKK